MRTRLPGITWKPPPVGDFPRNRPGRVECHPHPADRGAVRGFSPRPIGFARHANSQQKIDLSWSKNSAGARFVRWCRSCRRCRRLWAGNARSCQAGSHRPPFAAGLQDHAARSAEQFGADLEGFTLADRAAGLCHGQDGSRRRDRRVILAVTSVSRPKPPGAVKASGSGAG